MPLCLVHSGFAALAEREGFHLDLALHSDLPPGVRIPAGLAETARVDHLRESWNRMIRQFGLLQRCVPVFCVVLGEERAKARICPLSYIQPGIQLVRTFFMHHALVL
jgi:hypothetical protein